MGTRELCSGRCVDIQLPAALETGTRRTSAISFPSRVTLRLGGLLSPHHLSVQDLTQPYFNYEDGVFGDQAGQALFAVCQMRTYSDLTISSCLHIHQTALDTGNDLSFSQSRSMIYQLFPGHAPDHLFRHMLRLDGIEGNLIAPVKPYLHIEDNAVTSRRRRALALNFRQKCDPARNSRFLPGGHRYWFSFGLLLSAVVNLFSSCKWASRISRDGAFSARSSQNASRAASIRDLSRPVVSRSRLYFI